MPMTEKLSSQMRKKGFPVNTYADVVEALEVENQQLKGMLDKFEMRFGSYGTYNHTDILREIERLSELTHTLDKAVKLSDERAEKAEAKLARDYGDRAG